MKTETDKKRMLQDRIPFKQWFGTYCLIKLELDKWRGLNCGNIPMDEHERFKRVLRIMRGEE